MLPLNLSILISKLKFYKRLGNFQLVLWTVFFLVIVDVLVNVLFPYPYGSKGLPNFLEAYFEYGRSSEGKLRKMVAESDDLSSPITKPGWLEPSLFENLPTQPEAGRDLLIATYGGSFNQRVSRSMQAKHGDRITVRDVGAPGGPLHWTYAAYQMDRGRHKADAAVLTLISFTVANRTIGGQFGDFPAPYTRPIYFLENSKIKKIDPTIKTLPQLKKAIRNDPALWDKHVDNIKKNDPYYNPILFEETVFDNSSIVRILRRFYGKNEDDKIQEKFYNSEGFIPDSETVEIMKALVKDFAKTARDDGIVPVVYLANAQGWSDHLHLVLKSTLKENSIPYVSSHTLVPTDDPRLFLNDGHFIPEKDEELADEIIRIIQSRILK